MIIETARTWVYPAAVKGRFQRLHRATGLALQAILFLTPWIQVAGRPLFQVDIAGRRLYAFGATFTPADNVLLVLLGLGATFALFLFTAVFGRLWCGYACPQTVFLEEWIRPVEAFFEGDRGRRRARDRRGWTVDKAWRKLGKWTTFAALSGLVAMTFVSWFAGARMLWTGQSGTLAYAVVAFLAAVMFWDFAWFREQFCNFLCPYARLQGVLCDDHSLVVAYDQGRGEPRGKGAEPGACIDCLKCVAVCPQGIDIRDGFQLECVTCARCVDACEGVMGRLGQTSLVSYATQSGETRVVRARTVVYGALAGLAAVAFLAVLSGHDAVDGHISRSPGSLFTIDGDGYTRNTYLLRLTSHEQATGEWAVEVQGLPATSQLSAPAIRLAPSATATVPVVVRVPPGALASRSTPLRVRVYSESEELWMTTSFLAEGG